MYEEKTLQLLSETFTRIVMKSPILGKLIGWSSRCISIKIELEQHTENLSTVVDELTHTSLLDILEAEGYEEKALQLLPEAFTRIVMKSPILGKVIGHHGV